MTSMPLPHTNGSQTVTSPQSWLQSSVQVFFTAINWEDNPPEVQEIKLTVAQENTASPGPISLNFSVSCFFATINWDGVEVAAPAQQAQATTQHKPDDLTLDDFSSLF